MGSNIRSLHHGAVPVSNIGRSYRFYSQLFGAELSKLLNVNTRALTRGLPEIALLKFQGCAAFGLALQYEPIPRSDSSRPEGNIWGFQCGPNELEVWLAKLSKQGVQFTRPTTGSSEHPIEKFCSFLDPDMNAIELSRVRPSSMAGKQGSTLCYVNVEADDLAKAHSFYSDVLGLNCEMTLDEEVVFSIQGSGQYLIVRKVKKMSARSRLVKGPHVAFETDFEGFDSMDKALAEKEKYWQRDTNQLPWQEPWQRIVYFYDPSGNRLALVVP